MLMAETSKAAVMKQKPKPLATGLAFLFLALLLAGLFARYWASEKAYDLTGPIHIAAGGEQIYLFAAGDMYRLDPSGKLLDVLGPEITGLDDDPIDLRVLANGQLLIAEQGPALIRLCDVETWSCRPVGTAAQSVVERQFKVVTGVAPDELLLTDARGDTLWGMQEVGGEPRKLVEGRTLAGPNGLAYSDGGKLWVADTDHRRILELIPSNDGHFQAGREHSAMNRLTVGERFFPIMLERTVDGRLWVTQAAEYSEPHSDLLVYDPEDGVEALVSLPRGAYATDIVISGDLVLVTDLEQYTVYRVDSKTLAVGEFGDTQFRQRMEQVRQQRGNYDRLGYVALAAVILFAILMILAAVMATPKEKRWTRPPEMVDLSAAASEVPRISGIHWLERDPKVDRSLKWLGVLGYLLPIALVSGSLVLYAWVRVQAGEMPAEAVESKLDELLMILLLSGVLLALVVPLIRFSTQAMKHRLGTDGKRLYIRLAEGRELTVEPSQLAFTGKMILYKKYTFPLQGGKQQAIYLPGEVQTWLAPLLLKARKLTEKQAMRHMLKNQGGNLFWWLAASLLALLALALLSIRGS